MEQVDQTDLQPVDTAPTGLIKAGVVFEHFDHEPLASILDAFLQERLDLLRRFAIR